MMLVFVRRFWFVLFLSVTFSSFLACAKSLSFEKIVDHQGETLTLARGVTQDQAGFLWAVNEFSVHRFDGYRFDSVIPKTVGRAFLLDSKGRIWVSGEHRLVMFDTKDGSERRITNLTSSGRDFSFQNVNSVIEMPNGEVVLASDAGLSVFDEVQQAFVNFDIHLESSTESAPERLLPSVLHPIDANSFLLGTNTGLYKLSLSLLNDAQRQSVVINNPLVKDTYVKALDITADNRIVVGAMSGLILLDLDGGNFRRFVHQQDDVNSISDDAINTVLALNSDEIWIGTNLGLDIYDRHTQTITRLYQDAELMELFGNGSVKGITRLGQQVVVATNVGIYRHILDAKQSNLFARRALQSQYPQIKTVWSIYQASDQAYWFGTYGLGLFIVAADGSLTRHTYSDDSEGGLTGNNISVIYQDQAEGMWVGTTKGLNYLAKGSDSFRQIRFASQVADEVGHKVRDIQQTANGDYWFMYTDVLVKTDIQFNMLKYYSKSTTPQLNYSRWSSTMYIGDDYLITGSDTSVTVIDLKQDKQLKSLPIKGVVRMVKDSFGTLWILSFDGLYRFDWQQLTLDKMADDQFFADMSKNKGVGFYNMAEDSHGQLWLGFRGGVKVFDIAQQKFVKTLLAEANFDSLNLLFGRNSMLVNQNGDIVFGEVDAATVFTPQKIEEEPLPDVAISRIGIASSTLTSELGDNSSLTYLVAPLLASGASNNQFDHDLTRISFEFAIPSHFDGNDIQYKYQLEGLDSSWSAANTNRTASYGGLAPGDYVFKLKAVVKGRETAALSYPFTIKMSPWLSHWAIAIYIVSAIAVLLLAIRIRTLSLMARVKTVEALVAQRTDELVQKNQRISNLIIEKEKMVEDIVHKTRTPFQLMFANMERLKSEQYSVAQYIDEQSTYIDQLVALTESTLFADNYQANFTAVTIDALLNQLVERYALLAQEKPFDFQYDIEADLWSVCDARLLEDIFENLLDNAFKYTNKGKVSLTAVKQNQQVIVKVSDTGIGIPKSQLDQVKIRHFRAENTQGIDGIGIGLSIVDMFIKRLSASMTITSDTNQGTEIECVFDLTEQPVDKPKIALQVAEKDGPCTPVSCCRDDKMPTTNHLVDGAHVLLVEDNQQIAQYYQSIIGQDYHVSVAHNVDDGIRIAVSEVPDIIITDVMMGQLSGYDFVQMLRNNDITHHIPVIMLTAKSDFESKIKGLSLGVNDYITKPVVESELLFRVSNQLALVRSIVRKYSVEQHVSTQVPPSDGQTSNDKLVDKYKALIKDNYAKEGIKTEYICDSLFVTQKQLERKIKQCLGVTPAQYLIGYRLEQAKGRLLQGQKVKDVYSSCGFSSHAYFSKKFKEKYACSPSEFATNHFSANVQNTDNA